MKEETFDEILSSGLKYEDARSKTECFNLKEDAFLAVHSSAELSRSFSWSSPQARKEEETKLGLRDGGGAPWSYYPPAAQPFLIFNFIGFFHHRK